MQALIEQKLKQGLNIIHLVIDNESHLHSGPATDSHFKVALVSDDFIGKRPVARHKMVYALLADEMAGAIHALVIHPYTAAEWQQRSGDVPVSAPCRGSVKK
ncbi:MAG: BolA/IbaG family iron-sulfur metabolism protein [Motiliproteus sp.]